MPRRAGRTLRKASSGKSRRYDPTPLDRTLAPMSALYSAQVEAAEFTGSVLHVMPDVAPGQTPRAHDIGPA